MLLLLILLEVSVKASCWLASVLACSKRATSMPLIVSVKATHWLTRFSACSQRATFMHLILLEVSVKATRWLMSLGLQPKGFLHATYSARSVSEIDSLVDQSLTTLYFYTSMQLLLEVSVKLTCWLMSLSVQPNGYLFCWKHQ